MSVSQCSKCPQIQKRLKIVKSDYEFQIKKMQQDKSTQKALYEIHLLKQIKRWQDLYEKQKALRQDQCKNWINKHDATVKKYENQIKCLKELHSSQFKNKITQMTNEANQKVKQLKSYYETTIKDLTSKYQETILTLKAQNQIKTNQIINENDAYVNTLKKSHKTSIDQKTKMYESKLLGAESQKIKQKKMHEQTKTQSKDIQSKLYKQIFDLRKNISSLQTTLNDQIKDLKSKQQIIQALQHQIEKLKLTHQSEKKQMNKQFQQQLQINRQEYKIKLEEVYKQTLVYCNRYQSAISKIEETRESQRGIYINNIEQINLFVQNRASRPEDIEEIQNLRAMLSKKIKECECLSQQLKFNRLQLENKQETYNKIFVPIANPTNQTILYKRKQFKLRRQGRSVTTVREALQCVNSVNTAGQKKSTTPFPPKSKIL